MTLEDAGACSCPQWFQLDDRLIHPLQFLETEEFILVKSLLIFEHEIDGTTQLVGEDGQGLGFTVFTGESFQIPLTDTGLVLEPYEGEGYRGAPNIAFGDVDGDGVPELIIAPGPDPIAPARIKVFKIDTKEGMGKWKVGSLLADLNVPFGCKMGDKNEDKTDCSKKDQDGYGANVAAGDLDGDGKAEILLGAGPDPKKNGQVIILHNSDGVFSAESFIAYEGSRYGISISSEDVDEDEMAEIITGLGPDPKNKSLVRIFRREGILMREFQAYPNSMKYGVRVSRGTVRE